MGFVDWIVARLTNLKSGAHDYFTVGLLAGAFVSGFAGPGVAVVIAIAYGLYLAYVESKRAKGGPDAG